MNIQNQSTVFNETDFSSKIWTDAAAPPKSSNEGGTSTQDQTSATSLASIDHPPLITWGGIGLREVVSRAHQLKRPIRGLYLFCTRQGQPYSDTGFKAMWNRVQIKWAVQGGQRFTFHDIRAKALTDAKRLGMDAQSLAGHATAAMTEHYIKQREFKVVKPLR